MKIWVVSNECSGLSEAGGVKDVTYSLCENFSQKNDVTLFIPLYGCTNLSCIKFLPEKELEGKVSLCGQNISVKFARAMLISAGIKVVFIKHQAYSEKKGVYVYTQEEEKENPMHARGMGHEDVHFLDSLLCKAVALYGTMAGKNQEPDIIHCQDASTALTPAFVELLKPEYFKKTKSVVTIHNAGPAYHHEFSDLNEAIWFTELPWNWLTESMNGQRIEPFLISSKFACLTTVSTFYAEEISKPQENDYTDGLSRIFYEREIEVKGITNGIDYFQYAPEYPEISLLPYSMNPFYGKLDGKLKNRDFFLSLCKNEELCEEKTDDNEKVKSKKNQKMEGEEVSLPKKEKYLTNFLRFGFLEASKKAVYFVFHGRLVWQKGIHVLCDAIKELLQSNDFLRFIIVGQGDPQIEKKLEELADNNPGKIVFFEGYNHCLPRLAVSQADFSLLPSSFEPCCLEDFISQLFGTLPLAHATGGLKKIIDGETGFLYSPNTKESISSCILKAAELKINDPETIKNMIVWASNYVRTVYSWEFVTEKYIKLFRALKKA